MSVDHKTQAFIVKARKVHGDKYDYSLTVYTNQDTKVIIICPIHGQFSVTPKLHLSGCICKKCVSASRALTTETFISRSKELNGDKYSYPDTVYVNQNTKVILFCNTCKKPFSQAPNNHLAGNGCPDCAPSKPKHSTEKFVEKATIVHGNRYDYSGSVYTGIDDPITMRCPVHGPFTQRAQDHLSGYGCATCALEKRTRTTPQFIEEANVVHGNKYDYSMTVYESIAKKIKYGCPDHGVQEQNAGAHLAGHGCWQCYTDSLKFTTEEFKAKSNIVHEGKYDYSKSIYIGFNEPILVICPIHGEYMQSSAGGHLNGTGCYKCTSEQRTMTTEEFIRKARAIHGNKYDYSKTVYINYDTPVTITCPVHDDFQQTPDTHLHNKGCGRCFESKGETALARIFDEAGISYQREYTIPGTRYRYDFYLPDHQLLIEFHGGQHYNSIPHFGGDEGLAANQERDQSKRTLAKLTRINLICFKYTLLRRPKTEFSRMVLSVIAKIQARPSTSWFYREYA